MRAFFLSARIVITRFFYCAIGLRISHWSRIVESMWSFSDKELEQALERCLRITCPKDANGISVKSLQELRLAEPLTKSKLREKTAQKTFHRNKFYRHTAGTSGEPTDIWLDRDELGRMLAVRDYCYRKCGISLYEREARLWGRPEKNLKRQLKDFLLNRRVFHTVGDRIADEIKFLIQWRPKYIYGYASIIMECARELERTGRSVPGLHCVICTAETILPFQKEYLSKVFNCPVFEEYGATEFDIIAYECSNGHRHLVNPWLIIEAGSGGQCLVTDVSRSSQSLVRYELGDVVRLFYEPCGILGSRIALAAIIGRTIDRFAFIDAKRYFHAVEFSYAVDRYQRQTNNFFRFTIFQVKFAEFELFCEPLPVYGFERLAQFIVRDILEKTGFDISVRRRTEDIDTPFKYSYFVQTMKNARNYSA